MASAQRPGAADEAARTMQTGDAMADLEAQAQVKQPISGFVAAKQATGLRRLEDEEPTEDTAEPAPTNADEVALDVDED